MSALRFTEAVKTSAENAFNYGRQERASKDSARHFGGSRFVSEYKGWWTGCVPQAQCIRINPDGNAYSERWRIEINCRRGRTTYTRLSSAPCPHATSIAKERIAALKEAEERVAVAGGAS